MTGQAGHAIALGEWREWSGFCFGCQSEIRAETGDFSHFSDKPCPEMKRVRAGPSGAPPMRQCSINIVAAAT
ncbi:MAG TPA: hypothetical protein VHN58_01435 [Croceicoccus sp.]|nr:hypothetical protein [Croceicoccus sp.]